MRSDRFPCRLWSLEPFCVCAPGPGSPNAGPQLPMLVARCDSLTADIQLVRQPHVRILNSNRRRRLRHHRHHRHVVLVVLLLR